MRVERIPERIAAEATSARPVIIDGRVVRSKASSSIRQRDRNKSPESVPTTVDQAR